MKTNDEFSVTVKKNESGTYNIYSDNYRLEWGGAESAAEAVGVIVQLFVQEFMEDTDENK